MLLWKKFLRIFSLKRGRCNDHDERKKERNKETKKEKKKERNVTR